MTKYEKYKIVVLGIFVIGFLFCCYEYSQNGRYVAFEGGTIDTRTGETYFHYGKVKVNLYNYKNK